MFWDNFDGAFDYERFPSERNAFLDSLNRDARYDGKIIAYAGAIAPCESRFEVGYCLAATVLGGVFGDASDGVVSVSSALSYRSSQDQRTRFRASRYYPDYDHSQLAAGRGDNGLFSNLRTDLLATAGTQPANPSQSCQAVVIAVGSTVEGALTGADCGAPHRSGRPGDVYRLQLTAGQRIRISMDGGSLFDPYLLLVSPSGVVVAEDDDSGVLLDAAIDYVVAATGIYSIEASSYDADDRGTYTLRIVAAASTCTPASVSLNSRHAGALTDSDCVAPHRSAVRADVYQFNGQAGQRITIRMTGLTLGDPYLILVSGSTVIARDDDAGGGLDAFIQITLPSTGAYQIEATAYDDSERGTYQLDLTAGAGPASAVGGRSYGSSAAKKYGKELAEPR